MNISDWLMKKSEHFQTAFYSFFFWFSTQINKFFSFDNMFKKQKINYIVSALTLLLKKKHLLPHHRSRMNWTSDFWKLKVYWYATNARQFAYQFALLFVYNVSTIYYCYDSRTNVSIKHSKRADWLVGKLISKLAHVDRPLKNSSWYTGNYFSFTNYAFFFHSFFKLFLCIAALSSQQFLKAPHQGFYKQGVQDPGIPDHRYAKVLKQHAAL